MITVGSLFSGIGGIEYGLEKTGGFKTIWMCENDPYASAVLKKHWPEIPNLGDITKVDWGKVEKPDLLCGGFPCQDISVAGKGKGIQEGKRSGLWFEFARAIRSLRPRYALIENVSAIITRGLDIVLADLAQAGYDAEWFDLRASDVGAWHRRERIFIVAYAECKRLSRAGGRHESKGEKRSSLDISAKDVPNTQCERRFQCEHEERPRCKARVFERNSPEIPNTHNSASSRQREISRAIYSLAEAKRLNLRSSEGWWAAEPDVDRVAHGVSFRVDRIKCLGNAVVPQVAEVIGKAIMEYEKQEVKQ